MSDYISRQAAIDAILAQSTHESVRELYEYTQEHPTAHWDEGLCDAIDAVIAVDSVPSAQPYTEAEIQKMQELEQAQLESAYAEGYTAAESKYRTMMDSQTDLDEWCTDCKEYDSEKHCCPRWNRVIRNTLKDAQPERDKGHWIKVEPGRYKCSECGVTVSSGFANFCHRCGSYNGG